MDDLISVCWHENSDDPENKLYELIPEHETEETEKLHVSVPAADVTERAARAKLIEKMFQLSQEIGIDPSRLRFHV